jgi:hypothetical protein
MFRAAFSRVVSFVLVTLFGFGQLAPHLAVAGTTGGLYGVITDPDANGPIAGVKVTVSGPGGVESSISDAGGRFAFVSLPANTYKLLATKDGYQSVEQADIAVFADEQVAQWITLRRVGAHRKVADPVQRGTSLVHQGTTADMTAVTPLMQDRGSVLGGGGDLNSAYSAIALAAGAVVPSQQSGNGQAVHVRGGDSNQIGYEIDGVPTNRAYDNLPSGSISSLGQQELQIYTGATPANAEAQALAGFVNQVIKTGVAPGYIDVSQTFGMPAFYHSLTIEAGGATPDRNFSYYLGFNGFNQAHRYIDQTGGSALADEFGPILDNCPSPAPTTVPSCFTEGLPNLSQGGAPGYIRGPIAFGSIEPAVFNDRSVVANLHIAIPHRRDSGRDDLQILYNDDQQSAFYFTTPGDEGLNNFQGTTYGPGVLPYYLDTYQYVGPQGSLLNLNTADAQIVPYYYPSSPTDREFDAPIAVAADGYPRDAQTNTQAILKVQYQRNFTDNAFLRVYGYSYYSNFFGNGPISSWQPYTGYDSGDYEIASHMSGVSATLTDQLSSKHLLSLQGSYMTANSQEMYNLTMFGGGDAFAVLVNPQAINSGICYALPTTATGGYAASGSAAPTTCNDGRILSTHAGPTFASLYNSGSAGALTSTTGQTLPSSLASYTCGGGPCAFFAAGAGFDGDFNAVTPHFSGFSINDTYVPNDRLSFNIGVRLDQYTYAGDNTVTGLARAFWIDAINQDSCYDQSTYQLVDKSTLTNGAGNPLSMSDRCAAAGRSYLDLGSPGAPAIENIPSQVYSYDVFQPRMGAAFTLNTDTVLRASYGEYNQQPSTELEQIGTLNANFADVLAEYYRYGFNTPGHDVRPPISYNADFSLEHRIRNTDMSFEITPFYRHTRDQIQSFYVNIKGDTVSGLNAGEQTSSGFEFSFQKGDFDRDGLSTRLAFAYTNAYITFSPLSNGATILTSINADIQHYNAYTSACAKNPSSNPNSPCFTGVGQAANTTDHLPSAACYTPQGTPDAGCAPGDIANPYWNAPAQPIFDPSARYLPYSIFPTGIGTSANSFIYPYVATLTANYKRGKWAVTPSLQFQAGNRYGAPETTPGIDPALGCSALAGATTFDPGRYPYGGVAPGAPYDAATCNTSSALVIPDPYTGHFDALGAFREPAQLLGHLQLSYAISPKLSLSLSLANLLNRCFGGQTAPFTYASGENVCGYSTLSIGSQPVGNIYDPGDNIQTALRYPYQPQFGMYNDLAGSINQAFSAYLNFQIRI